MGQVLDPPGCPTEMAAVATAIETPAPSGDRLPNVNDLVIRRYRVTEVIGDGGYGTVLGVIDETTQRNYAIKTEKYSRSMLHIEVHVLKVAREKKCKHFAELIDQGSVKRDYVFVVMTLLGRDLHKLRNDQPYRRFSPATAVRVAVQTLEAIQELHSCGFLSRDIKPGNFVIGRGEMANTIFLIDFGLARKYCDKNGNVLKSRGEVGWRGTARYGSLQAHLRRDLGRKDDIESWLYMSVELWRGALPWRHLVDRPQIQALKMECRTTKRFAMFYECPRQYSTMLTAIDTWSFEDEPKYDDLFQLLEEITVQQVRDRDVLYDWEDGAAMYPQHHRNHSHSDRAQQRIGRGSVEPMEK